MKRGHYKDFDFKRSLEHRPGKGRGARSEAGRTI